MGAQLKDLRQQSPALVPRAILLGTRDPAGFLGPHLVLQPQHVPFKRIPMTTDNPKKLSHEAHYFLNGEPEKCVKCKILCKC